MAEPGGDSQEQAYRVLSIQSHVVHGYVGNKCAVFALQTNGVDVDPINTVQFSNNTGYPTWRGQVLQADQMWQLYEGLCENNLTTYSHILTGYVNSLATLDTILKIVKSLKERNPNLKYFCDPVMGDGGELYRSVPQEMVQLYRTTVFPLADVVFPNQTEIEFLTDVKINSEADALAAIEKMHSYGPKTVILKSAFYGDSDKIYIIASHKERADAPAERFRMHVTKLPLYFTGTGDLFSSLTLAYSTKMPMLDAIHRTVSAIQAVLQRSKDGPGKLKEIKLIQSREDLLNPHLIETMQKL